MMPRGCPGISEDALEREYLLLFYGRGPVFALYDCATLHRPSNELEADIDLMLGQRLIGLAVVRHQSPPG